MPKSYAELLKVRQTLEKHFKDVQDIEFTIQEGKLFMLQTRNGKRTAMAALKFSMDMVKEKLIDWQTAILRNPADQLDQLLAPVFDLARSRRPRSSPPACPPAPARPRARFISTPTARRAAEKGEKVLLVRVETSPEDLRGMIAAEGILTARGGVSSHAALVARQMGKVCVCGASALQVDYDKKTVTVGGQTFNEGDFLSIDGTAGTSTPARSRPRRRKSSPASSTATRRAGHREVQELRPADEVVRARPRACRSAPTPTRPEQAANAVAFGAVGASASPAPSTCSSRATASTRCAR
jgi:pyruvate, orthophosphate dikinase